ncbi:hypothetical protein [Seohaeicola zhoushanensis]|uniref:Uncharacterized protein n=1 Tax=Seohaeicola zhoushanensis TaxID=1569283 RepID=A0A8J3GVN1_9RHOB|nr:hypothetical protein [Seohaeicola zhoushanensis]GHF41167.1 hypothetical protein GCM10017056_10970 [Seohaeicola zhoushanensis]
MADKPTPTKGAKTEPSRDERLKAALKANLARRKAQARARAEGGVAAGKHEEQD